MIYATGDIHGGHDIFKLNKYNWPKQKALTKDDYLIICGDCGLVWDESAEEMYWRKWLGDKPFTTLFVDGNHENFDKLLAMPTQEKFGGVVREIWPDVYHLPRGQVLTIDGKKVFVMGGARSHDKEWRTEGKSWWSQEMPAADELRMAAKALDEVGWNVDFVFTHCAPTSVQRAYINGGYGHDELTQFLDKVALDLEFEKWYFGHYHTDKECGEKYRALYYDIVPVK